MSDFLIETISKESLAQINELVERINSGIDGVIKMNREFKNMKLPSDVANGFSAVANETKKSNKIVFDAIELQEQLQKEFAKRQDIEGRLNLKIKEQSQAIKQLSSDLKKLKETRKSSNRPLSEEEKLYKKLKTAQQQLKNSMSENGKELIRIRDEKNKLNRKTREEERLASRTTSLYDKIDLKAKKLIATYNELAIRKEAGRKLTIREEAQMLSLEKRINKYVGTLKKVDAQSGKFNRSVGSYGKQFDGLGFSIAQITREAPAFANSMQTGFMAISNNIPMAVDEIQKLRTQNKALAAEGKPTRNVLRSIGAALFSWQTLLSVGVTLLTLYGDEIVKWAGSLFGAKQEMTDMTKVLKELDEKRQEAFDNAAQGAAKEYAELLKLRSVAEDVNSSSEDRNKAVNELQRVYPSLLGNLSKEKILSGDVADAYDLISQAIITRAKAEAASQLLENNITEQLKLQLKKREALRATSDKERKQAFADISELTKEQQATAAKQAKETDSINQEMTESDKKRISQMKGFVESLAGTQKKSSDERIESLKSESDQINKNTEVFQNIAQAQEFSTKKNAEYNKEVDEQVLLLKKDEQALLSMIKTMGIDIDTRSTSIKKRAAEKALIEQILALRKDELDLAKLRKEFNEGIGDFQEQDAQSIIDGIVTPSDQQMIDELNASLLKNAEILEKVNQAQDKLAQKEILFEAFNRLEATLGIQAGTFETIFEGIENGFDDVGEAAQAFGEVATGAFNAIMESNNARLENQKRALQVEKETAIAFAGDSTAARAQIEERFDKRQAEIRAKQARNQKAQALFNIGISTAQGIIKTIANVGFPAAIPLIAAISAIGLAQTAIVASREIPQFKDGVRNFEGGWAVLGDGGVNEYARTPDGKVHKTPAKDTLYYLPSGTDVYKDEADFHNSLNTILGANDINPLGSAVYGNSNYQQIVRSESSGITKQDMESIMRKTLASQTKVTTHFDKNGITKYVRSGHSKKEILNAQVTFKGIEQ